MTAPDKQLNLVVNGEDLKLKAFLETNPRPTTVTMAEAFFRKRTSALIQMKKDHDLLRIVLKNTDFEEDSIKFEKKSELPVDDRSEWERKYILAAQDAYDSWLSLERQKQ